MSRQHLQIEVGNGHSGHSGFLVKPTPGTYPRPRTNSLCLGIPESFGSVFQGRPGVCSFRGMLGGSLRNRVWRIFRVKKMVVFNVVSTKWSP